MKTETLRMWVKALVGLHDGKTAICPNCNSRSLDYGYIKTSPIDNIGFGAVWCEDCHHAFHISRANVKKNETHIVSELPQNLVFV